MCIEQILLKTLNFITTRILEFKPWVNNVLKIIKPNETRQNIIWSIMCNRKWHSYEWHRYSSISCLKKSNCWTYPQYTLVMHLLQCNSNNLSIRNNHQLSWYQCQKIMQLRWYSWWYCRVIFIFCVVFNISSGMTDQIH